MNHPLVSFTVIGTAQPQGSAKAFYNKKAGRAFITSDNVKLKPWRQEVSGMALVSMNQCGAQLVNRPGAVRVKADFYFDRPKSQAKVDNKTTKPDVDKLLRSCLDSLTGIVFEDDSQVIECVVTKSFGQPARLEVSVSLATPQQNTLAVSGSAMLG